jgi:hypothetical protein
MYSSADPAGRLSENTCRACYRMRQLEDELSIAASCPKFVDLAVISVFAPLAK